jgi:transcriptional regulator with XRE-family HTH domain
VGIDKSIPIWYDMVMSMTDEVREAARRALKEKGWTQELLAKEAGVKQATVSRFLSGDRNKAAEAAIAILDALGLKLTVEDK